MPAPKTIVDLVKRFEENKDAYLSGRYNETELRRDFLDPFFEALGWDVKNVNNHSERYRDVIHEQSVEVEGQAKSADYLFKIGATPVFFVEAKKPSVDIVNNPGPAFQLKTYAWSKKLPLSLLTDFETLAFYECTSRPLFNAPPAKDRVDLYTYKDYIPKWEEISGKISRNAVTSDAYDRYVQDVKGKHGTTDVDDDFLVEMERWRNELAHNIALRNPTINQREVNYAVQATIDRIIFLRICEDRGIEPEGALKDATDGIDVYGDLLELFRKADKRYNSGLFHFANEKGRTGYPDTLTPTLKIDDKVFKDILSNLYLPKSPYAFRYFSADILGQVYERFLGKVITLTPSHRAQVELKPEVRKAEGVYYTPTFIVNYIVNNTVGEILKDKTPETLKSKPIRILDPACGSGSFLIGAYQFLMDWHLDWYLKNEPAKWAKGKNPAIVETLGGWQLTLEEKKEILLNHIFGVDIDAQAVEVTKLSLLLKVVENPGQLLLFSERILPDLSSNVKCGNSLISPDIYLDQQGALFKPDEVYRVNAFDWRNAFPVVIDDGGFDVVVGNPPYIRIQAMKEWAPIEVEFFKRNFSAAKKGNYDVYVVFIEKALSLLSQTGRIGFILPHKFFNSSYGENVRDLITKGHHLSRVVHFCDEQVFDSATTYTCLLFLCKEGQDYFTFERVNDLKSWREGKNKSIGQISAIEITNTPWNFGVGDDTILFEKLNRTTIRLGDITDRIAQGIRTSSNTVYVVDLQYSNGQTDTVFSEQLGKVVELERDLLFPFLLGREIKRYQIKHSGKMVLIPYKVRNGKTELIPIKDIQNNYPLTFAYLLENKKTLEDRERGRMKGSTWYSYIYPKNLEVMKQSKILVPDIADRAQFSFDEYGEFTFTSGYGIVLKPTTPLSYKYILGVLNSKLLNYFLKRVSTPMQNGFFRYFSQFLTRLPIAMINFLDPNDVLRHDNLVALVDNIISLNRKLATISLSFEIEQVQQQIRITEAKIDRLVYELYDLTDEEIAIIESF